jgi:dTDP-4-dehydrorhamnose 3,5-epimerase
MKLIETGFQGLVLLEPKVFGDNRGHFMESFNLKTLKGLGLDAEFIQDNQSRSHHGVIRGLHYQNQPYAQTKLLRVLSGTILDVVVDLRRDQPTFGKHYAVELSAENNRQIYVPKGFAHGFSVLSEVADVLYKCDNYYHPEAEGGVLYNDPALKIDWGIQFDKISLSEKDKKNPVLAEAIIRF